MPVYVDQARNTYGRMKLCHMIADTPDELHGMALAIGMQRKWFQPKSFPHYDVSLTRKEHALSLGAVLVDRRQLVRLMRQIRESQSWPLQHPSSALTEPTDSSPTSG